MDELEKKLEKFKAVLTLVDDEKVSTEDFIAIIEALVTSLKENDEEIAEKINNAIGERDARFTSLRERFKSFQIAVKEAVKKTRLGARSEVSAQIADVKEILFGEINKVYDAIQGIELTPGRRGEPGKPGERGRQPNFDWDGTKIRFEKPDGTWGEWVDLKGEPGQGGFTVFGRSQSGVRIKQNGVVIAEEAFEIDLATNLTATRTPNGVRVTASGGGGGGSSLGFETPTGAVNDSNTSFSVVNTPIAIIMNGAWYPLGKGGFTSFSAPTITTAFPVGSGADNFIISVYEV